MGGLGLRGPVHGLVGCLHPDRTSFDSLEVLGDESVLLPPLDTCQVVKMQLSLLSGHDREAMVRVAVLQSVWAMSLSPAVDKGQMIRDPPVDAPVASVGRTHPQPFGEGRDSSHIWPLQMIRNPPPFHRVSNVDCLHRLPEPFAECIRIDQRKSIPSNGVMEWVEGVHC